VGQPRPTLKPQFVIETLRASTPPDTILVSGVGQHQMWPPYCLRVPKHRINSGGPGTMACRAAAIGPSRAPDRWCGVDATAASNDAQELATARAERASGQDRDS